MADLFALVIDGLDDLKDLESLPQDMLRAARIAVNDAATRGRTAMGKEVLSQINFPNDYVSPRNKRLYVSKSATNSDLEAVVTARSRPTSLARFAQGGATKGQRSVRVELKKGAVRTIPGRQANEHGYSAWLIRLRSGSADLDTKSNLGLAMRLPPGKRPNNAYRPRAIGNNVYLLYGPSVSQLVYSASTGQGVATELTPEIQQMLSDEFWRQMELK